MRLICKGVDCMARPVMVNLRIKVSMVIRVIFLFNMVDAIIDNDYESYGNS